MRQHGSASNKNALGISLSAIARLLLMTSMALLLGLHVAQAAPTIQQQDADNLKRVRALLAQPEAQIDIARAELEIERMIDPSIDVDATLRQLDSVAARVKAAVPANASDTAKMEALRAFLYQAGPWNQNNPFRYDLSDPMGTKVENKLLPHYLASRRGNCVSMPALFIALGQRLGLDVTAGRAPKHVFVKFRDENRKWLNLETTGTGAPTVDASYQKQTPMTAQALANGLYMRPLGRREMLTIYLDTLMQFYESRHRYGQIIALTDFILKEYPNSVEALLYQANAYAGLQEQFGAGDPDASNMMPPEERKKFQQWGQANQAAGDRAMALGWRDTSPDQHRQYLERIQRAQAQ